MVPHPFFQSHQWRSPLRSRFGGVRQPRSLFPTPQRRPRGRKISRSCCLSPLIFFFITGEFTSGLTAEGTGGAAGRRSLLTFFRCRKKVRRGAGAQPHYNLMHPTGVARATPNPYICFSDVPTSFVISGHATLQGGTPSFYN